VARSAACEELAQWARTLWSNTAFAGVVLCHSVFAKYSFVSLCCLACDVHGACHPALAAAAAAATAGISLVEWLIPWDDTVDDTDWLPLSRISPHKLKTKCVSPKGAAG
jgi:hypothetical protein